MYRARHHEIKRHSHSAVLAVKSWRKGGTFSMLCKDKTATLLAQKRSKYKRKYYTRDAKYLTSCHHILKLPMTGKCFGDWNFIQRGTWIQVLYDMKNYKDLIILHILLGVIQ